MQQSIIANRNGSERESIQSEGEMGDKKSLIRNIIIVPNREEREKLEKNSIGLEQNTKGVGDKPSVATKGPVQLIQ